MLRGHGLEIGALNNPAPLPPGCTVEYCDAQPRAETVARIPGLVLEELVEVQHVCDLDQDSLSGFRDGAYDFVILNHVLEHVANPIRVLENVFRIARRRSLVALSVPDKNFACDTKRPLTSFDHLLEEYHANVSEISDAHYLELLRYEHPQMLNLSRQEIEGILMTARTRREHVHVWDSQSFRQFLAMSLKRVGVNARCIFESGGEQNGWEYFALWQKERQGKLAFLNTLSAVLRRCAKRFRPV